MFLLFLTFSVPVVDSIVLLQDGHCYTRSEAVLRVLALCDGPTQLLSSLFIVPRFIRDAFYDVVGATRYFFFGMSQECRRPTPETRSRFIEQVCLVSSLLLFFLFWKSVEKKRDEFLSGCRWLVS